MVFEIILNIRLKYFLTEVLEIFCDKIGLEMNLLFQNKQTQNTMIPTFKQYRKASSFSFISGPTVLAVLFADILDSRSASLGRDAVKYPAWKKVRACKSSEL